MSETYASRLKKRVKLGVCGDEEKVEDENSLREKVNQLAALCRNAKHIVVHTGAGVSTAAGIPDFRGPKGVWTAKQKRKKPPASKSFDEARPTVTHLALAALYHAGLVKYIVTQNVDGLHLKSGIPRSALSEVHGTVFAEHCDRCHTEYPSWTEIHGMGYKPTGRGCPRPGCGGGLRDKITDWDSDLPQEDKDRAEDEHEKADLLIVLGSSLRVQPANQFPKYTFETNEEKPEPGDLVIVNLQETELDSLCTLRFFGRCDNVMELLMQNLGLQIPPWDREAAKERIEAAWKEASSSSSRPVDSTASDAAPAPAAASKADAVSASPETQTGGESGASSQEKPQTMYGKRKRGEREETKSHGAPPDEPTSSGNPQPVEAKKRATCAVNKRENRQKK